jgi:hypothetical protein
VLEQDVDGVDADVDVGRPVAERPHAGHLLERLEPEPEDLPLPFGRQLREWLVDEAVVADLMAGVANFADELRIGKRGVAGHEERRRHPVTLEQREDARDRNSAELAARHRSHIAERHLVRPRRERIEVEGQADREARRRHATSAASEVSSAMRTPSI